MPNITDWIMVIITAVYVIATIAICVFNYKSAQASQNQIKESQKQFEEMYRPHIVAGIKIESDVFMCLYIKNIGNDVADNIEIAINQDWLGLINEEEYLDPLQELISERFMLVPGQEIVRAFTYVIVGVGNSWLDVFNKHPVEICISYNKQNTSISYNDKFVYNIKLFRSMFKEKEEHEKEIKKISKSLKSIASASDKIVTHTKSIADKVKK